MTGWNGTFLDGAVCGDFDDNEKAIDDAVQEWHTTNFANPLKLHDHLGMTYDEYERWVQDARELQTIIDEHRAGAVFMVWTGEYSLTRMEAVFDNFQLAQDHAAKLDTAGEWEPRVTYEKVNDPAILTARVVYRKTVDLDAATGNLAPTSASAGRVPTEHMEVSADRDGARIWVWDGFWNSAPFRYARLTVTADNPTMRDKAFADAWAEVKVRAVQGNLPVGDERDL